MLSAGSLLHNTNEKTVTDVSALLCIVSVAEYRSYT